MCATERVFKKTSPNSVLTLYLGTRDVICRRGAVEPLRGVIFLDPKFVPNHKIFGQLTLTFRYGREDEEVMGLKFCNEAIIALKQIWPRTQETEELSQLQQALIDRLGKNAHPFSLEIGQLAPPSVQLIPAKRYNGAPIGTSYDIRIHMGTTLNIPTNSVENQLTLHNVAEQDEERLQRRSMVRLGVRVIHKVPAEAKLYQIPNSTNSTILPRTLRLRLSPKALKLANKFSTTASTAANSVEEHEPQVKPDNLGSMSRIDVGGSFQRFGESRGPEGSVDKPFLWTDGRVSLRAALNKSAYGHGEHISVTIEVRNNSRKIIRKIRIFAVQHVDVCMFSNGKFKNVVADINENHEIRPGELHRKVYSLLPIKGPTKNWIAVEGSPSHSGMTDSIPLVNYSYKIASSAPRGPQLADERNVFAIYVSYYIKVKLALSGMGGEVTLKLPFILGHIDDGSTDNQDRNDVAKKLDKKIEGDVSTEVASGNDDGGNGKSKFTVESTDIGDVNSCQKNCIDGDVETGTNGIKTIAKCRNENGLSIDVIVEDLSDQKIESISGDGLGASPRARMSSPTNCNETERNINVVTAQIHSSAV
ncbi:hypothetical protein HA402_010954 [Bradysia odoriphaga]|nr:hypothetical protein HA402_010954 [Bradysia odoriphaga]